MDITRNWRLKTSRSQLLAARDPETGNIILPQQTIQTAPVKTYAFETEEPRASEATYAAAAR